MSDENIGAAAENFPEASSDAGQAKTGRTKTGGRFWLVLAGGVLTGLGVGWLSRDWCCLTTTGVMAAVFLIWTADRYLLVRLARAPQRHRLARVILVAVVAGGLSLGFRVNPSDVFERALGGPPPSGVSRLTVDSNAFVGPGDSVVLFRFVADEQTITDIVKQRGLVHDDTMIELWYYDDDGNWQSLWKKLFGNFADYGGRTWELPPPMKLPRLYYWENTHDSEQATLLWDADSGRAYVLYTFG